jgi:hypothetical protein
MFYLVPVNQMKETTMILLFGIANMITGICLLFTKKCGTFEHIDGHFIFILGVIMIVWSDLRKIIEEK